MTSEFKIVEEPKKPIAMHPKKFAMWLFLASIGMLFAAWTSAYIVRRAEGNWFNFDLPYIFWISSAIISASSATMILAYRAAKKNDFKSLRINLILTVLLGISFLVSQLMAAGDMVKHSAYFSGGNVSSSFVYVLAGVHFFHIVSAIIYVLIILGASFKTWSDPNADREKPAKTYASKVNAANLAPIEMCSTYWHFLGGLWLYLFVFLSLYR